MDAQNDSENPVGKNIHVIAIVVSVLFGIGIGAGVVFYKFRNSVSLSIPQVQTTGALSYPAGQQKLPSVRQRADIIVPKKLVTQDYYLLINKVVNELQQVQMDHNEKILPLMNEIKQKSGSQDFNGLFDLIIQARSEIKGSSALLATTIADIASLKTANDAGTTDEDLHNETGSFLASANTFSAAFSAYLSTLNDTLSGSVPTQSLLDTLAGRIVALQKAGADLQSQLTTLLALIDQKDKAALPQQ